MSAAEQRTLESREAREALRQFILERNASRRRPRLINVIAARVSTEERKAIDRAATKSNMTPSRYIRTVVIAFLKGDDVNEALRPRKARDDDGRQRRVESWDPANPERDD